MSWLLGTRGRPPLLLGLIAVGLGAGLLGRPIAAAAQRYTSIQIGPNPSTTNLELVSGGDILFKAKVDTWEFPQYSFVLLVVTSHAVGLVCLEDK
jgi:hypothetical protein